MPPIRVLHFADVHIGMENYGKTDPTSGLSSRVVDFLRRMDEMIEYARQHDVDLIIFAGDAFKNSTPTPTHQREFAHRVRDLAQLAPVVLLEGNHDIQPQRNKASSIEIYDVLDVPNVWVASDYEARRIDTKRGAVIVGTAPYPVRARLEEALQKLGTPSQSIRQLDEHLKQVLANIMQDIHAQAEALAGTETQIPRLFTGHFSVEGASVGSERSIMLGRDLVIPLNWLTQGAWDYIALGHIHKYQNLTRHREHLPPVVYSGSLERIDFGEVHEPEKGFCWVELARGATHYEFVPVATRPMHHIKLDARQAPKPLSVIKQTLKDANLHDAIVKLSIELTPENDKSLNDAEARHALYAAGAFHIAAIERIIEHPERVRLGSNPEGLSPEELLERYFISKGVDAPQREILIGMARDLMQEDAS